VTRGARSAAWLFGPAAAIYLLDRLSKVWAEQVLQGGPPVELLPGIRLAFTTNPGGAFSIGGEWPLVFVIATVVVSALIVATATRHERVISSLALGLILGGALGNLTDRLVRGSGFRGHVVDFIDVGPWPVFNVADSAIVVGAILLAWSGLRARGEPAAAAGPDDD
jgi:signal peptidase II